MAKGNFILSANAERTAEQGVRNILAKLKKGYKNAAYEEADRKMLETYLNR